jgi:hypothetical protein
MSDAWYSGLCDLEEALERNPAVFPAVGRAGLKAVRALEAPVDGTRRAKVAPSLAYNFPTVLICHPALRRRKPLAPWTQVQRYRPVRCSARAHAAALVCHSRHKTCHFFARPPKYPGSERGCSKCELRSAAESPAMGTGGLANTPGSLGLEAVWKGAEHAPSLFAYTGVAGLNSISGQINFWLQALPSGQVNFWSRG